MIRMYSLTMVGNVPDVNSKTLRKLLNVRIVIASLTIGNVPAVKP
jgi:hypothetical protein